MTKRKCKKRLSLELVAVCHRNWLWHLFVKEEDCAASWSWTTGHPVSILLVIGTQYLLPSINIIFPALQLSIRIPILSIYRRNFVFHEIIYEVFCLCWFVLVGAGCVVLFSGSCVKTTLDNVITKCPKYLISNKTVDKSVLKEHNLLRLFCKFYLPVVFLHPFWLFVWLYNGDLF